MEAGVKVFCRVVILVVLSLGSRVSFSLEAPTGDGSTTNGYLSSADFDDAVTLFNLIQTPQTGLGPVFNDVSCGHCHVAPSSGGSGATRGHRAGFLLSDGTFQDPPGGSLIDTRALKPNLIPTVPIGSLVPAGATVVQAFRSTINALGDGYVEAVPDSVFITIANNQPGQSNGQIHGYPNIVPILEAPGATGVGRFGWKAQHASLVSFSADAFRNEMGITTVLFPSELTSNGNIVATEAAEPPGFSVTSPNVVDPTYAMVGKVANMMRSTPARQVGNHGNAAQIALGQQVFSSVGCSVCHIQTLVTANAGTPILGGTYQVPPALGNVSFHPYSDYLLHDVGTGDGIVMDGAPQSTMNMIRTTPLWGLSKRKAYLHDDSLTTITDAILAHKGEASQVIASYASLPSTAKSELLLFLQNL
jgi:CxxC motif-containing protein (DUF1111 family)